MTRVESLILSADCVVGGDVERIAEHMNHRAGEIIRDEDGDECGRIVGARADAKGVWLIADVERMP